MKFEGKSSGEGDRRGIGGEGMGDLVKPRYICVFNSQFKRDLLALCVYVFLGPILCS